MISSLLITVITIYATVIGVLVFGFNRVKPFNLKKIGPKIKFTIVIAFRDESKHLNALLDSILALHYPKTHFEVLLVNDESKDDSVHLIQTYLSRHAKSEVTNERQQTAPTICIINNIRTSASPKKDAITTAISRAANDWIITSDADCILPEYWLDVFDQHIQTYHPNCIVAPVKYKDTDTLFKRFQALDILSLQGATIGGFGINKPFLANGANFAYKASVFKAVQGFNGNNHIASGDDIFLLEKFKQYNAKKMNYLKSYAATVVTKPIKTTEGLIQQRLRWASKTSQNPNVLTQRLGIVIFLGNFTFILAILLTLFNLAAARTVLAFVVIKSGIDFLLVFKTARLFQQEYLLKSYLWAAIVYPIFNVYIVVLSFYSSYRWKDRFYKS